MNQNKKKTRVTTVTPVLGGDVKNSFLKINNTILTKKIEEDYKKESALEACLNAYYNLDLGHPFFNYVDQHAESSLLNYYSSEQDAQSVNQIILELAQNYILEEGI